jgi:photosystem II stability/assembly factor-like uncharacterized protein
MLRSRIVSHWQQFAGVGVRWVILGEEKMLDFLDRGGTTMSTRQWLMMLMALLVVLPVEPGVNQWTTGPVGGGVIHLAIDPTTPERVFVAMSSGIFRSVDHAASWELVHPVSYPRWIAFDPTTSPATVYVASLGGLIQSDDGGDTWTEIAEGLPLFDVPDESPVIIEVAPTSPATIYLGTEDGVYRTVRGVGEWTKMDLHWGTVQTIAIVPSIPEHVVVGVWGGGIFASDDAGSTWSDLGSGLPNSYVHSLALNPQSPSTIYAAMSGGFYRTTDNGVTWSSIGAVIADARRVVVDALNPTTVFVGSGSGGVYRSTDGGDSWTAINVDLPYENIHCLAVDPSTSSILYAGTSGGVFRSDDGGDSWVEANNNLVATSGYSLAVDPASVQGGYSTVYAATGDVFTSIDAGSSWESVSDGLEDAAVWGDLVIDPNNPGTIYAGTHGQGVYKTLDGAVSWNPINNGIESWEGFSREIVIDPSDSNTLYCSGRWTVFKTVDAGLNWLPVNTGLPTWFNVNSLTIDHASPSTLYVGTDHEIFKTVNGGISWTPANGDLPDTFVNEIVIDPSNPLTVYAATGGGTHDPSYGVFRSTDGGATWSAANAGLGDLNVRSLMVDPTRPSTLYAGTWDGVYQSIDGADTWTLMSKGLPDDTIVMALALDPNQPERLYAGASGRGVFLIDLDPAASGFVWNDQDQNGTLEATEPSLIGISVHLLDADGSHLGSTTTDAQGYYSFSGLPWDDYMVEFDPPLGWKLTRSNPDPDNATDSDADPSTGRTSPAFIYAGRINLSLGAGLIEVLFADGFEDGDTSAWTKTAP